MNGKSFKVHDSILIFMESVRNFVYDIIVFLHCVKLLLGTLDTHENAI
jgi:hypothetical protein